MELRNTTPKETASVSGLIARFMHDLSRTLQPEEEEEVAWALEGTVLRI